MLHPSVIQYHWWMKGLLSLSLLLWALNVILMTPPGDIRYKPIPKEPPWPSVCPMAPDRMPCGLIY